MMIGNAQYQCSCVRYVLQDNIPLIVGLSVAVGLLLIIIVVVIVGILWWRRRRSKSAARKQTSKTKQDQRQNPYRKELTPFGRNNEQAQYIGPHTSMERGHKDQYHRHIPSMGQYHQYDQYCGQLPPTQLYEEQDEEPQYSVQLSDDYVKYSVA